MVVGAADILIEYGISSIVDTQRLILGIVLTQIAQRFVQLFFTRYPAGGKWLIRAKHIGLIKLGYLAKRKDRVGQRQLERGDIRM
ncbi:hypothetical protein D3C80_1634600 [compost metagenome]